PNAQPSSDRRSPERWPRFFISCGSRRTHTRREKAEATRVYRRPRRGFGGPVPDCSYADETPFVEAIKDKLGNVDVHYVHNNECDDFAALERFFIALNGPVRNPSNFGWTLGVLERARRQNCRVLL